MPTVATMLQQLLRKRGIGLFLANADIDSIAAGSITSVKWLRNARHGATNTVSNLNIVIWRPAAATAADYVRYASDLTASTGALTPDANWADTTLGTEDFYLLKYGIHPQWLIDAANLALGKNYFANLEPLSIKPSGTVLADAGFQSPATTSYVESDTEGGPATTFSKVTTANSENVFRGIGSGRVLNAATGGYVRQRFNVTAGETVVVHAISRLDAGTNAELVIWDVTNSAQIGTTVEHAQEAWQFMRTSFIVPATCKIIEVRLQGEGTTADVYWNGIFVMPQNARRVILDTKWESAYRIPALVYADLRGVSVGGGIYDAFSAELTEIPEHVYSFDMERPGANPYALTFHDGIEQYIDKPIYISGRRAYSDLHTLALSDITTNVGIDLDLWEAETSIQLLSMSDVRRSVPESDRMLAEAIRDRDHAASQFVIQGPARRTAPKLYGGRIGN